jgi:hypothetical protein
VKIPAGTFIVVDRSKPGVQRLRDLLHVKSVPKAVLVRPDLTVIESPEALLGYMQTHFPAAK